MKQLYAIRAYGGSYDDAWERVQCVTDDLAKGEAYVARMNARQALVAAAKQKAWYARLQWQKNNMRGHTDLEISKWYDQLQQTYEDAIASLPEDIQQDLDLGDTYWDIGPVDWLED